MQLRAELHDDAAKRGGHLKRPVVARVRLGSPTTWRFLFLPSSFARELSGATRAKERLARRGRWQRQWQHAARKGPRRLVTEADAEVPTGLDQIAAQIDAADTTHNLFEGISLARCRFVRQGRSGWSRPSSVRRRSPCAARASDPR